MTDKHAQMREMARDLIRNSVIEDAIAQRIAQIVEFIHEDRIKPLQQRAYTRADMEAAIQRALEGAANAAYHWWDAPDAAGLRHHIRYNLDPAQFIKEGKP